MGASRKKADEEITMDMTPMIDCTFQLLIFFLCTIKFKVLEGKIPAYLPKDVGVNATPIDEQLEKIEIHVKRNKKMETDPKVNKNWIWDADQISIKVGPQTVPLARLADLMEKAKKANPEAKATIYPWAGTLYIDAVKVVNECLRANFMDITFAGTPMDS